MKHLLFFLTLLLGLVSVAQPSVQFKSMWLNNDIYNKQICAHCHFTVSNLKGVPIKVYAYVKTLDGGFLEKSNGNTVYSYESVTPSYSNSEWEDFDLKLDYSKVAIEQGTKTYKIAFYVYVPSLDKWFGPSPSKKIAINHLSNDCSVCHSTGFKMCLVCSGNGYLSYPCYSPYPPYSLYYQQRECSICGGTGKTTCQFCKGEGVYVINSVVVESEHDTSSGSSYSPSLPNMSIISNQDNSSSNYRRNCPSCGGTGLCSSCNGSKGYWENTGLYTGKDTQKWITCHSCHGSGKCFNCHGRGYFD